MKENTFFAFLILCCFCLPLGLFGQQLGIKAGLNYGTLANNIEISSFTEYVGTPKWHAGLFADLPIADNWGLQGELLYSQKGAKIKSKSSFELSADMVNFDYLELPLMAYMRLGPIKIQGGAAISAQIAHNFYNTKTKESFEDVQDLLGRDVDFSLLGGIAYPFKRFNLSARYQHGLAPMMKDVMITDANGNSVGNKAGNQHRTLMLSLGYTLWQRQE
ncbi:MAG: porin family protein [Saprospiraceae bacterium]